MLIANYFCRVKQKWFDYKLKWDPNDYGGVEMLYVPSEQIWLPDVVLFNNWDGNYEVTLMTKAILKWTGEVFWSPPAIYKVSSSLIINLVPCLIFALSFSRAHVK